MLDLKLYTGPTKLIVAFDIGTTYSGISYCILEPGRIPEILGVTRFPAQELARGYAKVPSLLYYDNSGTVRAAGAEVLTEAVIEAALTEGWTKAEWWKLHLCPKHLASSINLNDDLPPLPPGKSAVDVLTDFIKYLFQCAKTYIQEHHLAFTWSFIEHSIEYIFTHPNGWEGVQQLYRRAIERAGLIPSTPEGRSRVHMLTEDEASLHFCVPNLLKAETVDQDTPRGVVIIDAGRLTIDLSMFSMRSNPISCEEIAPAECRLQGGDFVTRRAKALLQRKLDGWEHSSAEDIAEFTREFDQTTKLVIKSDQERAYVKVATRRYNNSKYNILFGKLMLSGKEATDLFNDSYDAIIGAFEQQQKSATTPITTAFCVGGLSTNDWLWFRLQSYFNARNISIFRPDNHINKAVANGAVLCHVDRDNHLVASRNKAADWTLATQLQTAREEAMELKAEVDHLQADKSILQSALEEVQKRDVNSKEMISTLESKLEAAQKEAAGYKAKPEQVAEANQKLVPGIAAFKQWIHKRSINAGTPILDSDSSHSSGDIHNVLAYNALLNIHLQHWSLAFEDAQKSVDIQPSAMGYIVKALAQTGRGKLEEAMQVFDFVFGNCNPNESTLLLLIKTIILFVAGKHDNAILRMHDLIPILRDDEIMYCYIQVLGKMYLMRGDNEHAMRSLERGQGLASSCTGCHLETISIIFEWRFDGLRLTALRCNCEVLLAAGRATEAAEVLLEIVKTFSEDVRTSKMTADWVTDLKKKCVNKLEALGNTALSSGEHDEAIAWYSSALRLEPSNPIDILVKRSKARASKGLWADALTDANEVIRLDPSSHWGYERQHAALHGAEDYVGATNAVLRMLSIIENSLDKEIRRLRENYTSPRETISAIDAAIQHIFKLCPLVLIDVTSGRLCDAEERRRMFKSETPFKKLVSETAITKVDHERIFAAVAKYFEWIMFSHTWEGREPTFQDVAQVDTVWSLDRSPLDEKLRQFCTTTREDGYRWAWSDTCCIEKGTSSILSRSLISMYGWYEEAAATLVYLADVLPSGELGDLTKSRWMTRAWTLQELLASKVIRFYGRDWKPYLNDIRVNHKESPAIQQELARAMGVAPEAITHFRLDSLGVREKLRLASTRNATEEEDLAYSLLGIFSSDIIPRYGLGKTAIGHLLENIIARSGDLTVIAWTGKSSPYNSALPDSLAVYSQTPYSPPAIDPSELDTRIEQLHTGLAPEYVQAFYRRVLELPRATCSNRCLHLPCIVFSVKKITVEASDNRQGNLYCAMVSLLGKVEFRTPDVMPLKAPRKLVFIYPWLRDLREPDGGLVLDDEQNVESVAGPGDVSDDASAPSSPLHAEPSTWLDSYTLALRSAARLERPFSALLLEQQIYGRYKRVAAEHEIIIPGVPYRTNFVKDIQVKVLEIV